MADLLSVENGAMAVRLLLCLLFIIDLLLLLRRNGRGKPVFSQRTSTRKELYSNLSGIAAFILALGFLLWMDIYVYRRGAGASTSGIIVDIVVLILVIVYFSVPKKIVISDEGILYRGSFYGWKELRSLKMEKDMLVIRRDRLFLLPPIRIMGSDKDAIREFVEEKMR